jgi:polyribonucleotide nucleotidyltransferase
MNEEHDPHVRVIDITGSDMDAKEAEKRILSMINEKRSDSTEDIPIASEKVGLIIGKGGETIQSLQRKSGARISIKPEDGRESGIRMVNLSGSSTSIATAKNMINDIIGGARVFILNALNYSSRKYPQDMLEEDRRLKS